MFERVRQALAWAAPGRRTGMQRLGSYGLLIEMNCADDLVDIIRSGPCCELSSLLWEHMKGLAAVLGARAGFHPMSQGPCAAACDAGPCSKQPFAAEQLRL